MFVKCPSCAQSLPQGIQQCQFCGTAIAPVAGAKASVWHSDADATPFGKPQWVYPAYNFVAGYFVVSGLITMVQAMLGKDKGAFMILGLIFGGINLVLGIGLLAKVELIRGVVNFVCGIGLLLNAWGILTGFPVFMMMGFAGLLMLFHTVFDMVCQVAMIYLIGETD